MKITLNEKNYFANKVKAKMFRKALTILEENDLNNLTADTLDNLMLFVCDIFENQFTLDEIYEGLDSDALIETFQDALNFVIGKQNEADNKKKIIDAQ